jgi:hypothetical protein
MVNLLGHRVLAIALSDRPSSLAAALALLRIADPAWREPKEIEAAGAPASSGAMIYPRADLARAMPATIEIEGESVEVVAVAEEEIR